LSALPLPLLCGVGWLGASRRRRLGWPLLLLLRITLLLLLQLTDSCVPFVYETLVCLCQAMKVRRWHKLPVGGIMEH
jgi:hypothetical protein